MVLPPLTVSLSYSPAHRCKVIGLNAAKALHTKMLWRLLKSPVSFFDQTSV